jgi:hypothetical protein
MTLSIVARVRDFFEERVELDGARDRGVDVEVDPRVRTGSVSFTSLATEPCRRWIIEPRFSPTRRYPSV